MAVLVAGLLEGVACAQGADVDAMKLRRTPLLEEKIPSLVRRDMPTFLSGDSLNGQIDERVVIEGQAELRNRSTVLRGGRAETCASIAKATCTRRPRPNWRSKLSAGI